MKCPSQPEGLFLVILGCKNLFSLNVRSNYTCYLRKVSAWAIVGPCFLIEPLALFLNDFSLIFSPLYILLKTSLRRKQ